MKFYFLPVFFLVFLSARYSAQEPGYKEYFMEGSYLLLEDEPQLALKNFEIAYKLDSSNANIHYMLGICYLTIPGKKAMAERFLEKAVRNISARYKSDDYKEKAAAPLALFFYGKALHFNYKFDAALGQYEAFRKYVNPEDADYVKMLEREEIASRLARLMVKNPVKVKVTNLGDSINTEFSEYGPVLSGDEKTLIYTTRRPGNTGGLKDVDGSDFEDMVVSYKNNQNEWTRPIPLAINTIGHEAAVNLSIDGQILIMYKNEAGGPNPGGNGNIYYTEYNGKDWQDLKEFGSDVNSLYVESHACLSADGTMLFFSSERPGGQGGKDLYRCIKLPTGKWSKALNMGPNINSEFDEDGGFFHPDCVTFYYSSNGYNSMGGYDIMVASLTDEGKFENITNIGYPINSTDDDLFYVNSPDAKRAYFSSAHTGGKGDKDIYMATFEDVRETYLALFKGQIIPEEGQPLPENLTVVVTDKQTQEVEGIYRPKMQNGSFTTILPPGREYNFSYQEGTSEQFHSEDIYVGQELAYQEIKREVFLEPVKLGDRLRVKIKDVYLSTTVLDDPQSKKPVENAKVILEEEGGSVQYFTTDASGKADSLKLSPEKTYTVYTEVNGERSPGTPINTIGTAGGKLKTETVYAAAKKAAVPSKNLLLNAEVKHPATKKPISGVTLVMTDANGKTTEAVTDEKGQVNNVMLLPNTEYEIYGYKGGVTSEKQKFTTGKGDQPFSFNKAILLAHDEQLATEPSKQIVLNTTVTHPETNKPLSGINIVIKDSAGKTKEVVTDSQGNVKNVSLQPNTTYEIYAYKDSLTSEKQTFTTGSGDELVFNKSLALPYDATSKNIQFSASVKHPTTKKAISGVTIVLTDESGKATEVVSDEKGQVSGVTLLPNTKYEYSAYKDNVKSQKQTFTTGKGDKPITITKPLTLAYVENAENNIKLNSVVKHPVSKKPIAGVTIVLKDATGKTQEVITDENGKIKDLQLKPNTKYEIYGYKDNVTSSTQTFATGAGEKPLTLNKSLALKYESGPSKNLLLSVTVKHPMTKNPIPGVNIVLTDASNRITELTTDPNGEVKDVALLPNTRYEIYAYKYNVASEKQTFTTGSDGKPVSFDKSILLSYSDPGSLVGTPVDSSGSGILVGSRFEFYYTYGQKTIDKTSEDYSNFVQFIVNAVKENKTFTLYITGAASKVPMRKKGGNPQLAMDRMQNFKELITRDLAERGVDVLKINFSTSTGVSGPEYRGDYIINRKMYEKYQYVKSAVK